MVATDRWRGYRACILGSGLTALGALRGAHACGLRPLTQHGAPSFERYSRFYASLPGDTLGAYDAMRGPGWTPLIIFPCSDESARELSQSPAATPHLSVVASPRCVSALTDKQLFRDTLSSLELPQPKSFAFDSTIDLNAFAEDPTSDWFLKPVASQRFFLQFGVKGMLVRDVVRTPDLLNRAIVENHRFLVQELIPGAASAHFYLEGVRVTDGSLRGLTARKRLRMYPDYFGNSTAFVSSDPEKHPDAFGSLQTLLTAIDYRGIFSAEFKSDLRTDRDVLIEINPRPWWYIEFSSLRGANLIEIAAADKLGIAIAGAKVAARSMTMIHTESDAVVQRQRHHRGEISMLERFWDRLTAYRAIARWNDPGPALAVTLNRLVRRLKRTLGIGR